MRNEIKYQYIKRLWYLKNGVIYSKRTDKPISFSSNNAAVATRCLRLTENGMV